MKSRVRWVVALALAGCSGPDGGVSSATGTSSDGDSGTTPEDVTADETASEPTGSTGEPAVSWCFDGTPQPELESGFRVLGVHGGAADGRDRVWMMKFDPNGPGGPQSMLSVFVLDDAGALVPISTMTRPGTAYQTTDINGDGLVDVLFHEGLDPPTRWWLAGLPDSLLEEAPRDMIQPWDIGTWLDANGDGLADFFEFSILTSSSGGWGLRLHLGDGSGMTAPAGSLEHTTELDSVSLWPSPTTGRLVVQLTDLAVVSPTYPVARAFEVSPLGEIEVTASQDWAADSVSVRTIDDLDDDGVPDVVGLSRESRAVTLTQGSPGVYDIHGLGSPITDMIAGRFASSDHVDVLQWDDAQMTVLRWDGESWLPAEPVTVGAPWAPNGAVFTLQADGEGGREILAAESVASDYSLWSLHPCE